ncbi:MotA/TolQ/ExbB proton channel family protein [Moritella viscosa]|uniref:MotA/TolQ/ExbB proton channel family protein n=1 Tax=Moritella viscosa TaxID=80854 RepID=UPI00090EF8B5|nr:MotA/TolQ/ExbB proton channel family protein [Moritella viscosa]SHO01248.1 Putative biopolymer transport proteinExbB-related protein [Moritella viscosa]SHO01505.1 Putative biopolymer transport proteinExbB-related protein [Moritella viscosa]SHO05329.1 Putative biopolymer transport proteinExbB-related protein [Moritella viscosa]
MNSRFSVNKAKLFLTKTLLLSVLTVSAYTLTINPVVAADTLNNDAQVVSEKLLKDTKQDNKQLTKALKQREAGFKLTEQEIKQQRQALLAQQRQLQNETETLSQEFTRNEEKLAKLETNLRLETGSLGELFGVVRQSAKQLNSEISTAVTAIDSATFAPIVVDVVAAKTLPSMLQLTGLWSALSEQIKASGEIKMVNVAVIDGAGQLADKQAVRIGSIGLVGEKGYLTWNGEKQTATAYLRQPEKGPVAADLINADVIGNILVLDPSRGVMLTQLENTPTLKDLLENGGTVGYVIISLLVIGLLIATVQGTKLVITRRQIRQQLANPSLIGDNPLGRILQVYVDSNVKSALHNSTEALELRLMEVVVDEQQGLEKGLSMLKLLAALAPMLGLLGTVTGMIETFQVITQFGNGDPKVMAGGISMALITTVLGLVAAMPLLLAHNILSTQADNIRDILEKQGISLVAEEAEKLAVAAVNDTNVTPFTQQMG